MDGFYLEFETDTKSIKLYHRYPIGDVFFIMNVLGYWCVPEKNWVMERDG